MLEEYSNIYNFLKGKRIDDNGIKSFIDNNKDIIDSNRDNICDRLFLLYNHDDLYCILLTINNNYLWSLYKDNEFGRFKSSEDSFDNVVSSMVMFTLSDKVRDVYPDISKMELNDRIKILKKSRMNRLGYHFE